MGFHDPGFAPDFVRLDPDVQTDLAGPVGIPVADDVDQDFKKGQVEAEQTVPGYPTLPEPVLRKSRSRSISPISAETPRFADAALSSS